MKKKEENYLVKELKRAGALIGFIFFSGVYAGGDFTIELLKTAVGTGGLYFFAAIGRYYGIPMKSKKGMKTLLF